MQHGKDTHLTLQDKQDMISSLSLLVFKPPSYACTTQVGRIGAWHRHWRMAHWWAPGCCSRGTLSRRLAGMEISGQVSCMQVAHAACLVHRLCLAVAWQCAQNRELSHVQTSLLGWSCRVAVHSQCRRASLAGCIPAWWTGHRGKGEDACACGAALRGIGRTCDGDAEVRRAARDELRRGAHCIKIMASGGVSSPTDRSRPGLPAIACGLATVLVAF